MCRLQYIAMHDYQESVTTDKTPDKVIPMCRYALQATQIRVVRRQRGSLGGNHHYIEAMVKVF